MRPPWVGLGLIRGMGCTGNSTYVFLTVTYCLLFSYLNSYLYNLGIIIFIYYFMSLYIMYAGAAAVACDSNYLLNN